MPSEICLPSPEWISRAALALKTPISRICDILRHEHGIKLLQLELRASGHDAFATDNYFLPYNREAVRRKECAIRRGLLKPVCGLTAIGEHRGLA